MGQLWNCEIDNGWEHPTSCRHEIVFVWNVVNKNALEAGGYVSEQHQLAFFLHLLDGLKDRMDSGCAVVGLVKYGSCAYIRQELSGSYNLVRDKLMYVEGSDPAVDSVGLGDGYSNLLAAYYQVYQVLNNPTTSLPAGPVFPFQRYKDIVMATYDVWGLDWVASHPAAPGRVYTSGAADAATGNPGFTASQPDDHQILYYPVSYPAPTYHMSPMSWFWNNVNDVTLVGNNPWITPPEPWDGTQNGGWNTVDWDLSAPSGPTCAPDMGQAQTWFMENIHPTLHGQASFWPGPFKDLSVPSCDNCYTYPYTYPVNGVLEVDALPERYYGGNVWYFVMDNQMKKIETKYNELYGDPPPDDVYVPSDTSTPGANWPPYIPLARNYFEDTYLKANQCGQSPTEGGNWNIGRTGDGIYLDAGDFGWEVQGEFFKNRLLGLGGDIVFDTAPTCVSGHSYPGSIWTGPVECPGPTDGAWTCPPGYELVYQNGEYVCCITETTEPIIEDQYLPISLDDEFYFKDISWTVSYDPKSQAWMSFHDWHPELCLPSINHFMTTKTFLGDKDEGSIWKHNQRCDSFVNYYGEDYPWEVELVESTGQAVNTVRNLEYQLESYVYKGNKLNPFQCGDDRWHDLNWNFDEAIIYNTEQVSGLLKLILNPQSDPITALQYPIINAADIDILYTKEEQKYRLNQFWDITKDRGEFTNVEQQIFLTQLNGYIRDLNTANLDYNKAPTQRKKFRHYYNKAILRRRISGNRKMLLKLVNTKLNLSFR